MIRNMKTALLSMLIPAALHAASVSGTVTVRGSGDPIAGATVVLVSQRGAADSVTTDAKGAYMFDSAAVGFHSVAAYKTGYQAATANVTVIQTTGKYTANIAMTATVGGGTQTGTISGTLKDDSTKEAIPNATVILSHAAGRGQPTDIDTVKTDGEGRFIFAAVPALTNYIVVASASGFFDATNTNVDVVAKDTALVPLTLKKLPKPSSGIIGTVIDAVAKQAVSGATVILRKRVQTGNQVVWVDQDTIVVGANGIFHFENIAASTQALPYSLLASKTDFNSATSANIVVAANKTDTIDVPITKIAKGSMSIFVGLDSTGNLALSGAAVAATLQGQAGVVYTGSTDAKGWVVFADVVSGSYAVSANLAGFVSKEVTRAVAANEKDTGFIYLARATAQNSKSLSGLVRDADGKAVEGAKIIFTSTGGNGITLAATSSATGDYSFSGIPTTVTAGSVTVSKDGFASFTGNVTLTGAASFLNVTLNKAVVSLAWSASAANGLRMVRDGRNLSLEFPAAKVSGHVSIFDARGSLITLRVIPAGASRAAISGLSARTGFVVLEQGAATRRLALPANP
jgi:hypothetical protein